MKTNKNNENLIAQLQYQLRQNKSMRNGAMCQALHVRIQKLLAAGQA